MRPTLFTLPLGGGQLGIPSYGVLVGVGVTLGILWFLRAGARAGLDGGRLQDLAFACLVAGFAGARLAFVLVNARGFIAACRSPGLDAAGRWAACTAALRFWDGGFVFYGGAVAVAIVLFVFCRRERWSFFELADRAAPAVALGHAIGRFGCLLAGCCYGAVCAASARSASWAVSFPPGSIAYDDARAAGAISPMAAQTLPLHPTQVYEALGELGVVIILWQLQKRLTRRAPAGASLESESNPGAIPTRRPGQVLAAYLVLYAGLRFVVEMFRGDAARGFLGRWAIPRLAATLGLPPHDPLFLTTSQFVSLVLIGAAVGIVLFRGRQPARTASPREKTA